MGDPITAGLVIGGASTLLGTGLELSAEDSESRARQREFRENQRLADAAAADAIARGNLEAGRQRMEGSRLAAYQKVAYAASGVDATVGTAAQVQGETRAMSELDARMLENNAAREAWGYKTQSRRFGEAAELDRQRSQNRQLATVLGGVGRLASTFGAPMGRQ